eukprot:11247557-Ditylum_brightwellii.AAC.1
MGAASANTMYSQINTMPRLCITKAFKTKFTLASILFQLYSSNTLGMKMCKRFVIQIMPAP